MSDGTVDPPVALTGELRWEHEPALPRGVALVLHGGQSDSERATRWRSLPVLRMLPFARSLARQGGGELAVARLRYAVRGWNGATASPLRDARATLDTISGRYPGVPVALVGHSMGGRVALHLAADPRVRAVVALAPWIERTDRIDAAPGQRMLVIHGLLDRVTSPRASARLVDSLRARGVAASFVGLARDAHGMLWRPGAWEDLTTGFVEAALIGRDPRERLRPERAAVVEQAVRDGLTVRL